MKTVLKRIICVMRQEHEKDISLYDESFLLNSLEKRLVVTKIKSAAAYTHYLANNCLEADEFYRSLNITYSEFFRNPLAFALLEQFILPGLLKEKGCRSEIRIWSAGCAAGHEPYSIAMLLDDAGLSREIPIPYRIFATDKCDVQLKAAVKGEYSDAAVQNVRLKFVRNCFTKHGELYVITPRVQDHVHFSHYDILDRTSSPAASIYGDFDIVFCSNVLYYYNSDIQRFILKKMHNALAAQGYLVTDEAERTLVGRTDGFHMVSHSIPVFQKD
jgi:chemotaxis protein methyltransferase CheR